MLNEPSHDLSVADVAGEDPLEMLTERAAKAKTPKPKLASPHGMV